MLLELEKKSRFCDYLANMILHFLHFAGKNENLDFILRHVKDPASPEFLKLREILKKQFEGSMDQKEMESIFGEIEDSLSKKDSPDL